MTAIIAWACTLWTPTRFAFDPFQSPSQAVETVTPDGTKGLHYQEHGFGWSYMYLRGERSSSTAKPDVFWSSPYGGTYHRLAGWPFYALRSRVEVLDSQAAGRFSEGQPEPEVLPQRRRWQLPSDEIIRRGVTSKDLPVWTHAKPDRRVPLIPLPLGFAFDTVIYAMVYLIAVCLVRLAWRIRVHNSPAAPNPARAPQLHLRSRGPARSVRSAHFVARSASARAWMELARFRGFGLGASVS
jgi:hypothetical protein